MDNLLTKRVIPSSMEFTVADFTEQLPQILSNVKELYEWAVVQTEIDRNLVLTSDEDIESARERCALLNKVIAQIDQKRKEVKKAYNKPYDTFERAIKEVSAVILQGKDNLWGQVLDAEQKIKRQKEIKYRTYWDSLNVRHRSWEQVFDKKWLNKGVKAVAVFKELDEIASLTKSQVEAIKALDSEFETALLNFYSRGATLQDCLIYNKELQAEKQANLEQESQPYTTEQEEPEQSAESELSAQNDNEIELDLRLYIKPSQFNGLKQYLVKNNIRYGRVTEKEEP